MDRFNVWVGSLLARSQDLKKDEGQTFVEYALVLAVVVVALLAAMTLTGLEGAITGAMETVTNAFTA